MTVIEFYWTGCALMTAWMLVTFEQRARALGSYRMVLELLDMGLSSNGRDRLWASLPDERNARFVLYAAAALMGLSWVYVLILLARSDR